MNLAINQTLKLSTSKLIPLVHPVLKKFVVKRCSGSLYQWNSSNNFCKYQYLKIPNNGILTCTKRFSLSSETRNKTCDEPPVVKKDSVFQKMKQMTKDYWHILIPVHIVTSLGWTAMFYAAAKNGVDIVGMMEYLSLSEQYLEMMKGSNAGHWAVTYALYKVFTPVRYTVTVGGTTMSIRYLNKWGYLKLKRKSEKKESGSKENQKNNPTDINGSSKKN